MNAMCVCAFVMICMPDVYVIMLFHISMYVMYVVCVLCMFCYVM